MATLSFTNTDRKVFTPIPSPSPATAWLGGLSNVAGTIIVLGRKTVAGSGDWGGIVASGNADWYHALSQSGALFNDDDGVTSLASTSNAPNDTTDWWWLAVDFPAAGTVKFRWRNHTTGGSWNQDTTVNSHIARNGPGSAGWAVAGWVGDNTTATKSQALLAIYAGIRFGDSDYGNWTKTSDLFLHPAGTPSFLTQLTSTTPFDLIGQSTYSSINSTGTALTGGDPPNFTFDSYSGDASGSDTFTRANETPLAGNWTQGFGPEQSTLRLSSNAVIVASSDLDASAYWNVEPYLNDQGSMARISVGAGETNVGCGPALIVRQASGARTYYRCAFNHAASNNIEIARFVGGTYGLLIRFTRAWTDGDLFELRVIGSLLSLFHNGVPVGSVSDSNIAGGAPGIGYSGGGPGITHSIDGWVGYDIIPPVPPIIQQPYMPAMQAMRTSKVYR